MKKLIISAAAVLSGVFAFGQQQFQQSQYLQNIYVINPAASGLTDYVDVNLSYRKQWAGLADAPQTYYITASSLLGKKSLGGNDLFSLRVSDNYVSSEDGYETNNNNTVVERKTRHALGGGLLVDNAGHFNTTNGFVSYAVHVPVGQKTNFSAGIKAGLSNLSFNNSDARLESQNDGAYAGFIGNSNSQLLFDANVGLFLYSDKFYVGYSTGQLFQNEIAFGSANTESNLTLHHYLTGGYRFALSDKVGLTPSTLVKVTSNSPISFDLNAKIDINKKFWAGLSYRNEDAIVFMAGLNVAQFINVGYSYDYTTSDLSNVSTGSHEILLNFMIGK